MDTCVEVSAIHCDPGNSTAKQRVTLRAANGTGIHHSPTLDLSLNRAFRWVFTVTDVLYPIIGIDLLHHFDLLVAA